MGGPWDKPNMDSEPGKARWLDKRKAEEMPHISDSNYHKGTSLSEPTHVCLFIHTLLLLINTLLVSLLSISSWKLIFYKAVLARPLLLVRHCRWPPVPGGLVARIQQTYYHDLSSSSCWRTEILLQGAQAESTWDQFETCIYTQIYIIHTYKYSVHIYTAKSL